MASTAWMKNKDDRTVALAEYQRLRALTAREVAEVMQPMLGSDNAALKSAAHRLYDGVTPREGYEEGENHEAENTLILDYALLLNDRVGPSPRSPVSTLTPSFSLLENGEEGVRRVVCVCD